MNNKHILQTDQAPAAIGTYSQAVKHGNTLYVSGQIPLDPVTMEFVSQNIDEQIHQVFKNLSAICQSAGGDLDQILKLNIFSRLLSKYAHMPLCVSRSKGFSVTALIRSDQFRVNKLSYVQSY